jgi:endonuclease-3
VARSETGLKRSSTGGRPTRETFEEKRRRAAAVLRRLARAYPDARCSLDYSSPLQLLVATILSAQCTDVRVNQVTPGLFRKYRTAADYARAPAGEL